MDQGIFLLEGDETAAEVYAVAFTLEEATRGFYAEIAERAVPQQVRELAATLQTAEVAHKERIRALCTAGGAGSDEFEELVAAAHPPGLLEDGATAPARLEHALDSCSDAEDILDLAMSVEVDALDLYLRLTRQVDDPAAAAALLHLAEEEKSHLRQLAKVRETLVG